MISRLILRLLIIIGASIFAISFFYNTGIFGIIGFIFLILGLVVEAGLTGRDCFNGND